MISLDEKAESCCPHRDYGKAHSFPYKMFFPKNQLYFFKVLTAKKKSHDLFTESFLERQKTFVRFLSLKILFLEIVLTWNTTFLIIFNVLETITLPFFPLYLFIYLSDFNYSKHDVNSRHRQRKST